MYRPAGEVEELVNEVFRRISSGGRASVSDLFTEDARYEGAYSPQYIDGNLAIAKMLGEAIPAAISPFSQWPVAIYPAIGGEVVAVEYESEGIATRNGETYSCFSRQSNPACMWLSGSWEFPATIFISATASSIATAKDWMSLM